jgi:hypothetical protein
VASWGEVRLRNYSTPGGTLLTGWSVGTDALGGLAEHRAGHRRHHHHRRRGKPRDGRGRLVSIFLELCSSSSFSPICTQAVCAEAVPRLTPDVWGFSYGSLSGRAAWNRASGTLHLFFLASHLEQTGSQTCHNPIDTPIFS